MISVCDKFSEIVKRGSRVALKQVHQGEVLRIQGDASSHRSGDFTIYASECTGAKWVTDAGMSKIGAIQWLGKGGDRVRVDLSFGASEIRATVVNLTTGTLTPTTVAYDFRDIARDSAATATATATAAAVAAALSSSTAAATSRGGGGVASRPAQTGAVLWWHAPSQPHGQLY